MIELTWMEVFGIWLVGMWFGLVMMAAHVILTIRQEKQR